MNYNNIEVYFVEEDYWVKGNIVGITGKDDYLVEDVLTNRTRSYKSNHIRFIISDKTNDLSNIKHQEEYNISSKAFKKCKINFSKGKFFSIEFYNKYDNLIITKLVRESELRRINYIQLSDMESNETVKNNFVNIPNNFLNWEKTEEFKDLVKNVNESFPNSSSNLIYLTIFSGEDGKLNLRYFSSTDDTDSIKLIIEITIENEVGLMKIENEQKEKIEKVEKIENIEKEEKINEAKNKIYIDKDLVGLLIGVKGINISNIKKYFNVDIKIQSEIQGDKALITVIGDNEENVSLCLNECRLVKKSFEITYSNESKLKYSLQDYLNRFNLYKCQITKTNKKGGNYNYIPFLNLIGTEENVELALTELREFI
jgi:hypothetical protein